MAIIREFARPIIQPVIDPFVKWLMRTFDVHGYSARFDVRYTIIKFHENDLYNPYEIVRTDSNMIVTTGLTHLVRLATGEVSTTLNNGNARVGSGDSTTAAALGQTNLQAATNKTWVAMDSGYPTNVASNATDFQARFGAGTGTWTWEELGIARGDPGSSGILIGRKVQSVGAKGAGDIWDLKGTLTASNP